MSDPIPPGPLESIWFVEATYAPDAAETRAPFRAEHLAGVRRRLESGEYVEAGAFLDVSASVVLVRAQSEEAALALVRDDVYVRNGVWVEVRARAFGRVTPE
ncbi:MAG TPA: YciI family protein [Methylomirabilota bacterium]|nr:YciI family protein [Methylomirabilota bacterium]